MPASPAEEHLLDTLRAAVGEKNLITESDQKDPYCTGFRFGSGFAIAVARPQSLADAVALSRCTKT